VIGVDVVDLAAMRGRLGKSRWRDLAFDRTETLSAETLPISQFERRLAMTWALKEAIVKALGTGFANGRSPRDVLISFDSDKPRLASAIAGACPHLEQYQLSCSATTELAVAVCHIELHECQEDR
jgi:phosphopantetheine--protein transferase-like protein